MSEKISVRSDVISAFNRTIAEFEDEYDRLLVSYREIYVLLAQTQQFAETRNRPRAYASGVFAALDKMEKSGFIDVVDFRDDIVD